MKYKYYIYVVFLLGFFLVSESVSAQNKIIVIRDDGSKEEIILNQDPVVAPKKEPTIVTPEPALSAEDLVTPHDNLDLPPVKAVTPKPKVKAVAPPKKKAKTRVKPKKKVTQKPKPQLPVPKAKPNEEEIQKAINAKPLVNHIDPTNIPEGTPITRALATRAALEVAPPSTGFVVDGIVYKERPSFRVRFKTEGGPHDVIIDGYTGDVLKNKRHGAVGLL